MLSLFDLAAVLLTFSAAFSWFNSRYLPLPRSVGLLLISVLVSVMIVIAEILFPTALPFESLVNSLRQIDFSAVVMNGLLAFLLFAGALHIDATKLRRRARQVAILACLATVLSTVIVGFALWGIAGLLGLPVSLGWALVFGALISPTDPVAVLTVLRNIDLPPDLEIELQGEALFNDGIGIVLFTVLIHPATQGGGDQQPDAASVITLLIREAGGGLLLGLATGSIAYWGMRLIDDYPVEVLISLALVTGTYAIAGRLGVSGPLSMVTAGLLIGDRGPRYAMSEQTKTYLFGLWTLIDEVLNSVLFLLIGLEVLVLSYKDMSLALMAAAVPIVILARLIAVTAPLVFTRTNGSMSPSNVPFLTWAGVHGSISVALALSMPNSPAKAPLLSATYAVVLFSIVVQGLTLRRVFMWASRN